MTDRGAGHQDQRETTPYQYQRMAQAVQEWETSFDNIKALVDQQAEDDGLWFKAMTAPEAYLQQELRRLHAAIEGELTDDD